MSAPAWQQLDFAESQEPLQKQPDSSTKFPRCITNAVFTEPMPKAQVLSYLVPTGSDSSDVDVYATLTGQTVSADSLIKGTVIDEHQPRHIIYLKTKPQQSTFISLQKWEGIVLDVMTDAFLARLIDLTRKGADEEAEFPMDEISAEDKPLVRPGAIFYWNIGYHTSYSGQRTRTSIMRFRRLPAWTQREIDAAKQEAERIGKAIGWK
jgi:hypothetical protein